MDTLAQAATLSQIGAAAPPLANQADVDHAADVMAQLEAAIAHPVAPPAEGSTTEGYRLKHAAEFFTKFCKEHKDYVVTREAFEREIVAKARIKQLVVPSAISICFMTKACQGRPVHSILKLTDGTYQLELNNKKFVTAAPQEMCTPTNGRIPLDYVFEIGGTNAAGVRSQLQGKEQVKAKPKKNKAAKRLRDDSESETSVVQPAPKAPTVVLARPAQAHAIEPLRVEAEPITSASHALTEVLASMVSNQQQVLTAMLEQQKTLAAQLVEDRQTTAQAQDRMMQLIDRLAQKVGGRDVISVKSSGT